MSSIGARLTLIDELSGFPGLTEGESGLLRIASANAKHMAEHMSLEEGSDALVAFREIGFRLDRLKRRTEDSNVEVFNPRRMKVKGPKIATVRQVG